MKEFGKYADNVDSWELRANHNRPVHGLEGRDGVAIPGLEYVHGDSGSEVFLCESMIFKAMRKEHIGSWDDGYKWSFRDKIIDDGNPSIHEVPLTHEESRDRKRNAKQLSREYRDFEIVYGLVRDATIS